MNAQFDNLDIFGTPTRVELVDSGARKIEESLPGVNGVRFYYLGQKPYVWTVRGRLNGLSLSNCKGLLQRGVSYNDGQLYRFTDTDGSNYDNCILDDFRQVGEFEGCVYSSGINGVTVEVQATVRWASPA